MKKNLILALVMKKTIVLLLTLMLCIGLTATANAATITSSKPAGSGTEASPYLIGTAAELYWFAENYNNKQISQYAYAKLTNDIVVNAKVFENGSLVSNTSSLTAWTPIGTGNYFRGVFDGDNYTISGLYVNATSGYQGLLGYSIGQIKNLTIADSYFKTTGGDIGAFVGYGEDASISNCHTLNCIITGRLRVGGIAGSNVNNARTFTNCTNKSEVICTGSYAGGIVGNSDSYITNCTNYGKISGEVGIGGIVGYGEAKVTSSNTQRIEDCTNKGIVTASLSSAGGIIGAASNKYELTNCHNEAEISGAQCVGGIDGGAAEIECTGCYNTGNITGSSKWTAGIVGYTSVSTTLSACYNTGNVTATGTNATQFGGLVGYSARGIVISKSYNTGDITGDSTSTYLGGLIGVLGSSSSSRITNSYNIGNVTGGAHVGGIAGRANFTINKCYNAGSVNGSDDIGGIVGKNTTTSTITNSYYLSSCSPYGNDVGTALTAAQMTSDSAWTTNYAGFDTTVWSKQSPNTGDKYYLPKLDAYSPYLEITFYTVTIASGISNGSVTVDVTSAATGETVTLSSTPAEGYLLDKYTVTDTNGVAVTVTNGVFTMPASNVTVSAAFKIDDSHSHAPCGEDSCTAHDNHTVHAYRAVDDIDDIRLVAGDNYYYLKNDISSSSGISVTTGQTLYLCLNGNDIVRNSGSEVIKVTGNGKLILCDCMGSSVDGWGQITSNGYGHGLVAECTAFDPEAQPVVEMYGGNITENNRQHSSDAMGAGVYLGDNARFIMYNGGITNNTTKTGGGLYLHPSATFVMYDGVISRNTAENGGGLYVSCDNNSQNSVIIHGGTISGNNATSQGGGLYVRRSNFNNSVHDVVIEGGSITENTAASMGAGLMVDHAHVKMNGGTISNNICANGSGGGVATSGSGRLHMSGGSITGNEADTGAGVYVGATFYVDGAASVTGNKTRSGADNNVYLSGSRCIFVSGKLSGMLGVYTSEKPTADTSVRYLVPSNYTITTEDLAHTVSDRSETYFDVKSIDQYNNGVFGYVKYKIAIAATENGTVTTSPTSAAAGETITLTVNPASAYKLDTLKVNNGAVAVSKTNDSTYTFTMPAGNVTVAATFSKLKYNITTSGAKNGTVTVAGDTSVEWGTTVTLTNTPASGFELVGYIVTDTSGTAVSVSNDGRFTMPASNVTVSATFQVDASHAHAPCGGTSCTDSNHPSHSVQRYRPWDGKGNLTLDTGENYYYLTADVTRDSMIYIESGQELYLCLGGHSLKTNFGSGNFAAFYIRAGSDGKLVLCDCEDSGKITPTKTTGELGRAIEAQGGSVEMYGGKITGCISGDEKNYRGDGSGVLIKNGKFTMYGGEISNNQSNNSYSYGGGVYVDNGSFTMHGGTISGNKAHYGGGICGISSTITITGGTISGNQATSDGGGIYARSRLVMSGGSISNNTSADNGGGIYNDVALNTIKGGTISGNSAKCGGGIYNNKGLLDLNGGTVTENTANTAGGICSNLTSAYSDAVSVSGNVNVSENKDDKGASNFHLFKGDCLTLTGPLKGQISVYTVETPNANAPVRFLQSSDSHTVTQADMNCITSDRTGPYFIKNIDQQNYGIFGKLRHSITVSSGENGSAEANHSLAESGTVVALTASPDVGYQLKEWQIVSGGVTVADDEFTMGSTDVEIKAIFEPASFNYTVETYMMDVNGQYGDAETASATGIFGSEVELIPEQLEGFTLDTDASKLSGEVKADGSLVLSVYYIRNQYEFTYIVDEAETSASYYYGESVPAPAAPAKPGHTFAGWDISIPATMPTNDVTVTAKWTINTYPIKFVNADGTVLHSGEVAYGETPVYTGETPVKAATAQYTYTFAGWSPEISAVTGEATYTAIFSNGTNTYTVTWVDEDGTTVLEKDEDVPYGTMPSYDGETPTKAADAQYTYTFTGWSPEIVAVTGEATYTATYSNSTNTYTVTWVDEDGTTVLEKDESVPYGTMPSFEAAEPTKATDAQYTYAFSGWTPAIAEVTGNATYKATYTSTVNQYTITFVNEDGTVLQSGEVAYGETPVYTGETPVKAADAQYTYTFAGWSPTVSEVTGNVTYKATYTSSVNKYTIKFVNEDDTVLQSGEVAYGETPVYTGVTPVKAADAQYTYTFAGWTPAVAKVTGSATYKATYTSTVNQYTITFVNEDGTVLQSGEVAYGETPVYTGVTPVKAADAQYTYTFAGWSPAVAKVTGSATYTATFSNNTNSYTVTWQNEAGELIDAESVEYGGSATKSPAVPDKLGYTGKWNHDGKNIVQNTIIKPEYTANQYTLTFNTAGGSIIAPITQAFGSAVTAPAAPTKEGWIFQGWDKKLPATMPAENLTLTATWIPAAQLKAFSLSADELWLHRNQTHQLELTGLDPQDAICEFVWTSSDPAILTVNNSGLLTASSSGTAVLTVTEKWSGLSQSCTVHIVSPVTGISFAESNLQMIPGDTRQLTATVTCPEESVTNKLVAFSSSNKSVATVDENGVVTAIAEGTVTITATAANGVSATCTINVLLLGDANNDGKVDVADVLIILQYSAGWDVTVNPAKADVTGDGTIGISDALKILQDCMGGDIVQAMRALQRMLADLNARSLEITGQPVDQRVTAGETAAFTVTATGDALQYQWYIDRNDGKGWQKLNNAAEATYVTSKADADNDGYQYRCLVTDAHGAEATTASAVLHVVLDLPNTGDASMPALWLAMCLLSGVGLMLLRRKKTLR